MRPAPLARMFPKLPLLALHLHVAAHCLRLSSQRENKRFCISLISMMILCYYSFSRSLQQTMLSEGRTLTAENCF
jgi:hypothetical protein